MASRDASLERRFRRHADWLVQTGRSPLHATLLKAAAEDVAAGGRVSDLFDGVDAPPGSVPQLRLLAALHELVLSGKAQALAEFYPSAGGCRPPDDAWPFAARAIDEHFGWLRERVKLTVQTNEPGRSAVLYAALLWLTAVHRLPIRLLEIGASAGVNLRCDSFCYAVDGLELGDPRSPVRFNEPWEPAPAIDLAAAQHALRIVERAGCDMAPIDLAQPDQRIRLLSYMWPDERWRVERARIAFELVGADPVQIDRAAASSWLVERLSGAADGTLTIVWHSVMRQYSPEEEWADVQRALSHAPRPTVELAMEPAGVEGRRLELTIRDCGDERAQRLAWCDDHGPPVVWLAERLVSGGDEDRLHPHR